MAPFSIIDALHKRQPRAIARAISMVENNDPATGEILAGLDEERIDTALVLGITGPPGAGKSTLTSRLIANYREQGKRIGVVAIDPTSPLSGGAILGDRIRMMRHALDEDVIVRSMASRGRLGGLCGAAGAAVRIMAAAGCEVVIIETVGVGQSEIDIIRLADITNVVLAPGLGDEIQAMKAGLLEVADLLVVNKADMGGAETLAMDMETMIKERAQGQGHTKVLRTTASEGQGLNELTAAISELDQRFRDDGTRTKRRKQGAKQEVLDWALELLRPRLQEQIFDQELDLKNDPREVARKIIDRL